MVLKVRMQTHIVKKLNTFKNITRTFNFNIGAIFMLALLNVLYKIRITSDGIISADNLWNPTWMLLGPFSYFAFAALVRKKRCIKHYSLHLLPFLIIALFFIINVVKLDSLNPWESTLYTWYQNSFFVIPISLICYAVIILKNRKLINALQITGELLLSISGFFIIIGLLYLLMYICWGILYVDMGIDYRIFTYTFLLVIEIFILRYVYFPKSQENLNAMNSHGSEILYTNSSLSEDLAIAYVERIKDYFKEDQSFLNRDISVELISKELDIPKYHFSQLFNVYLGKNFYTFIANRRIEYALKRLDEEKGKLKIESLAHQCGFNSKTSFNRYFKQITGYTPLAYLSKNDPVDTDIALTPEVK